MTDHDLPSALERLERALHRAGSPVVERLRPGVKVSRLDKVEERLGFELSADVRSLFRWHDGTDLEPHRDDFGLSLGRSRLVLPPLARAEENYREGLTLPPWAPPSAEPWVKHWFPVAWGSIVGVVGVSCLHGRLSTQVQLGTPSDVWIYRLPRLQALIDGLAERLESGTWQWGEAEPLGWHDIWWPDDNPPYEEIPAQLMGRLGIDGWDAFENVDDGAVSFDPSW